MAPKKTSVSDSGDIAKKVATLEAELYVLRMKKLSGELKETHTLRKLRKDLAGAKAEFHTHTI